MLSKASRGLRRRFSGCSAARTAASSSSGWPQRASLVLAAALVLAVGGSSGWAGLYFEPPGDIAPAISHDSSAIVLYRTSSPYSAPDSLSPGLYVTDATGRHTRRLPLPDNDNFALSRTWRWIAFATFEAGRPAIVVMHPDGSARRTVSYGSDVNDFVGGMSWEPSERRFAYASRAGIWVATVDGAPPAYVASGTAPAWSPDGARIAFVRSGRVVVTNPDGLNPVTIPQPAVARRPIWSPTGDRIAFAVPRSNAAGADIVVATRRGNARTRYPARRELGAIAWAPDGKSFAYVAPGLDAKGRRVDNGVWRVRLGRTRLRQQTRLGPALRSGQFPSGLAWAPNGRWLVTNLEGECKDRVGLYRLAADGRTARKRLSNQCRIDGSAGSDKIGGTPLYDDIYGLGGDDDLEAYDDNNQGDDLDGGAGNDTLLGGQWHNVLVGGRGNDRLDGSWRDDTLIGGPGSDILLGGGGKDTVYARDGVADRVDCGTSPRPNPERPDTAYVDRRDTVFNCERVRRG